MDAKPLSIVWVDSTIKHAGNEPHNHNLGLPADYRIKHVETADTATAIINQIPVDAILIDLSRQNEPDLEIFHNLHAYSTAPIIVLVHADHDEFGHAAISEGAQDYLVMDEISGSVLDRSIRKAIKRARAVQLLRRDRDQYELAIRASRDGVWDWDLLNDTIEYSPGWKAMLGYAEEDIDDSPDAWFNLVHPGDLGRLRDRIQDHITGQSPHFECEYRIRCRDGEYHWMLARGLAVGQESGVPHRMAGLQSNISDRKQVEMRLQRAALRDPLTGLDNRVQLKYGMDQALAASTRHDTGVGVLFLDLDNFKIINDSMGHSAGDHVLRIIARRLTVALREYDRIARFGGDEFTILIDDLVDIDQARSIANRVIGAIEEPIRLKENEVRISASIGIATCMTGETDPEYLLQAADIAMYDAKNASSSNVSVFQPSMMSGLVERLDLERKLRRALNERHIHLVYQPIVNLATSEIVAVEALARWQDVDGNWITPSTFIPLAEGTGLIIRLGQALLEQACEDIKRLQAIRPELGLNVNISSSELRQEDFVANVLGILEHTGLDPARLTLEINEASVMIDTLESIERLHELKRAGIIVAVDDFGTGHSSLSILQELPVDVLKIDPSFVQRLDTDANGFELVRLITVMAKTLRLSTIAEGIETAGQKNALLNLQSRIGQGFLLHCPMPISAIEQLLTGSDEDNRTTSEPDNPQVNSTI